MVTFFSGYIRFNFNIYPNFSIKNWLANIFDKLSYTRVNNLYLRNQIINFGRTICFIIYICLYIYFDLYVRNSVEWKICFYSKSRSIFTFLRESLTVTTPWNVLYLGWAGSAVHRRSSLRYSHHSLVIVVIPRCYCIIAESPPLS